LEKLPRRRRKDVKFPRKQLDMAFGVEKNRK
jgi:hypothetical protein